MAAPGYDDSADVEALIAYISNELIPQRVADLALARPRRILTRTGGSVPRNGSVVLSSWTSAAGDGGNGSGITYSSGVLTVSEAGIYQIDVEVTATPGGSTAAAHMIMSLRRNASSSITQTRGYRGAGPYFSVTLVTSPRVSLDAADELDVVLFAEVEPSSIGDCRLSIEKVA